MVIFQGIKHQSDSYWAVLKKIWTTQESISNDSQHQRFPWQLKRGHAIAFQAQKQQHGDEKQDVTNVVYHCIISLPEKKLWIPGEKEESEWEGWDPKLIFHYLICPKTWERTGLRRGVTLCFIFGSSFPTAWHCLAWRMRCKQWVTSDSGGKPRERSHKHGA